MNSVVENLSDPIKSGDNTSQLLTNYIIELILHKIKMISYNRMKRNTSKKQTTFDKVV